MRRFNLKNIPKKPGKIADKKRYKIQRNVVTKLNKKLEKAYFKEKLPKVTLLEKVFVTKKL